MPVNPKKYIDKLMKALEVQGRYYNYIQKRFYSKNVDRYVMKYILEDVQDKKRRLEVYNKLEILKFLVTAKFIITYFSKTARMLWKLLFLRAKR